MAGEAPPKIHGPGGVFWEAAAAPPGGLEENYGVRPPGPGEVSALEINGTPAVNLSTGVHGDYHTPYDEWTKINPEGTAAVIRAAAVLVDYLASAGEAGEFPGDSFAGDGLSVEGVYIGALPDYSGGGPGVTLLGVVEGSPAAHAGLETGDRVVSVSGKEISGIDDYVRAVREMSPGGRVQVIAEREGRPVSASLVPEKR